MGVAVPTCATPRHALLPAGGIFAEGSVVSVDRAVSGSAAGTAGDGARPPMGGRGGVVSGDIFADRLAADAELTEALSQLALAEGAESGSPAATAEPSSALALVPSADGGAAPEAAPAPLHLLPARPSALRTHPPTLPPPRTSPYSRTRAQAGKQSRPRPRPTRRVTPSFPPRSGAGAGAGRRPGGQRGRRRRRRGARAVRGAPRGAARPAGDPGG